ncbi:hypothetical protein Tco_0901036 [Tanacetum coccineum]
MAEDGAVAPLERKLKHPIFVFFQYVRSSTKMISLGKDILTIAVPAAMAFAADPVASLIDTAFIGHIDPRGDWEHRVTIGSIQSCWFYWNMDCSIHFHGLTRNCRNLEDGNRNGSMVVS